MTLKSIQSFYDDICSQYGVLRVNVYIVPDKRLKGLKGLYLERPFRKIYLNQSHFNERTVYHEIFHHLNPDLHDGPEFDRLLDEFISENSRIII